LEVFKIKEKCICHILSKIQAGTSLRLVLKGSSEAFAFIFLKINHQCVIGLRNGSTAIIDCDCICSIMLAPSCTETTTTFLNPAPIIIPDSGIASPYPSNILVAGLTGTIIKVTVQLNNLTHTFPDDIDILLVGPTTTQNAIVMGDVGGGGDAVNVTLLLDDDAPTPLPDGSPLVSGTFQPANYGVADSFPPPAPVPAGGSALSIFNGSNPNGIWSLYIVDDLGGDVGSLAGGWSLNITTCEP
jgi:subtilisin-like proprotein convertase family protein